MYNLFYCILFAAVLQMATGIKLASHHIVIPSSPSYIHGLNSQPTLKELDCPLVTWRSWPLSFSLLVCVWVFHKVPIQFFFRTQSTIGQQQEKKILAQLWGEKCFTGVRGQRSDWADRLETTKLTQKSPLVVSKVRKIPSVGAQLLQTFLHPAHSCIFGPSFSWHLTLSADALASLGKLIRTLPRCPKNAKFGLLPSGISEIQMLPSSWSSKNGVKPLDLHSSLNTVQGVWRLNKWGLQ